MRKSRPLADPWVAQPVTLAVGLMLPVPCRAEVRLRGGNGVCTASPRCYANNYTTVVNRIKAFSDL